MASWLNALRLEELLPRLESTLAADNTVVIGPKGTSMLPLIRQGKDYVELSAAPKKLRKYDLPLYRRADGRFVLHRVVQVGESYTCMGDNQFVRETGVAHSQVIAVVSAIYRKDKRIPVTVFSYQVYCRLWHWSRPVRKLLRRLREATCPKKH